MDKPQAPEKTTYTDQEINELAEWVNDLTIEQIFFLKKTYQTFVAELLAQEGNGYFH